MSSDLLPAPASRWRIALDALPLVCALALAVNLGLPSSDSKAPARPMLEIAAETPVELGEQFTQLDYAWPPAGAVPRVRVASLPAGLEALEVGERKQLFFSTLAPLVLNENERVLRDRRRLQALLERATPTEAERAELAALASRYGVDGDLDDRAERQRLLRRADAVPLGLALAQAAKESGWGTSRFAQEANNLFGVWTWDERQGMRPLRSAPASRHFVRIYPDLQAAVRGYLYTLNTGAAYADLRRRRAAMRAEGAPLDPVRLAGALRGYSERGLDYVRELEGMIVGNGLHRLGELELVDIAPR